MIQFPSGRYILFTGLCVLSMVTLVELQGQFKRVCYYTNWSKYRPKEAKFTTQNINPYLCTHLIFAFGNFEAATGELVPLEGQSDIDDYTGFSNLKKENPKLKTLLAIGGWNFGGRKFSNLVHNQITRKKFVASAVSFLRKYGFDGLDLDWEYPGSNERGGIRTDKENLVVFCKELYQEFTLEGLRTRRDRLLLTAAVPANRNTATAGYDVPALSRYLDFFNLMTYDFHGGWETKTGQNSPLFQSQYEDSQFRYLNVKESALWWHQAGVPKDKIIIGLATYGRSFTLSNPSQFELGAPASKGRAGTYTREAGFMSYYEICMTIQQDWTGARKGVLYFDTEQSVPYFVSGNLWVGFDSEQSLTIKTAWLKAEGYGGFMVWSLDLDDFNQMCPLSNQTYPLIKAVLKELGVTIPKEEPKPTSKQTPKVSATASAIIPKVTTTFGSGSSGSSSGFRCSDRKDEFYPDPANCYKYYRCFGGRASHYNCPTGLKWDIKHNICNWADQVSCTTSG